MLNRNSKIKYKNSLFVCFLIKNGIKLPFAFSDFEIGR